MRSEYDVAVVGGGLVGSAIAWGVARLGARVVVLDEGDITHRASRANFALIWIQSKGMGLPEYGAWSRASADGWPSFAQALADETGIDVALRQTGGFTLCLSDGELQARLSTLKRLLAQPGMISFSYEVLDHAETRKRLPAIGPDVIGSVFCPLDGHVNSLKLFRALHAATACCGVERWFNSAVDTITPHRSGFAIEGAWGKTNADKVVIAAGLNNARLAPMVGLHAPVQPSRGQIIVTEKVAPFLHYPVITVRQTDEGGVMIGDSREDNVFETAVSPSIIAAMADRALRMFPILATVSVVRTWSGLRVMTPDGFPIYDQSTEYPGAFIATCHSGVTLAPSHTFTLSKHIVEGHLPASLDVFNSRRFHVS